MKYKTLEFLEINKAVLDKNHSVVFRAYGGSMRPFINNGDIVTLRKVSPESLQCGDIIYFTSKNDSPVMHRIVSKTIQPDNSFSFTTKGYALLQKDVPINADQILGKAFYVEKSLPLLGTFSFNLDSILCSSLNRLFALVFSIKCKTRNYLKLIFCSLVNK